MKLIILSALALFIYLTAPTQPLKSEVIAAKGRMPDLAKDLQNAIHIVYGSGDSIMYTNSKDGQHFTTSSLVAVLPKLFASAMRGPQVAATADGLIVMACTSDGNIYAYKKEGLGKWTTAIRINNTAGTAKEALMDVSAEGRHAYAVWLGAKNPKGQNVYGAASADGGKTWSRNILVYASPDGTVCECCKPSVLVKGSRVYVMFRNWLNGNRDLYVTQSDNGGAAFHEAKKLGAGNWKLNGCPMDGGGLSVTKSGAVQTVWRRENNIYATIPGAPEKLIGEGKGCTIETMNGKNVYAWTENGEVIVLKPTGDKIVAGKGSGPNLKGLDNNHIVCVWENEQQIHSLLIPL